MRLRAELFNSVEFMGDVVDFRLFLQEGPIPEWWALIRSFVTSVEIV